MADVKRITEAILADARADAERILAEAQARCDEIAGTNEAHSDKVCDELTETYKKDGRDIISRSKSAAEMEKRNIILRSRNDLADTAFAEAYASIRSMPEDKYLSLLAGLLSGALSAQLANEKEVREFCDDSSAGDPAYGDGISDDLPYEVILNEADRTHYGKKLITAVRNSLIGKIAPGVSERLVLSEKAAAIDGGIILRCGDIENNCSLSVMMAQIRDELEPQVCKILFGQEH